MPGSRLSWNEPTTRTNGNPQARAMSSFGTMVRPSPCCHEPGCGC
jgi:hypothetical protein